MCVCMYVHMSVHAMTWMWSSEDSFWELVLTFHHVGLGDQTQAVRLGGKCLYPLTHLEGPQ